MTAILLVTAPFFALVLCGWLAARQHVLPESAIDKLFHEVAAFPGYQLTIDLQRQVVIKGDGTELPFDIDPFRKHCLLGGLDDIGLTLQHKDAIASFEAQRLASKPWLAHTF